MQRLHATQVGDSTPLKQVAPAVQPPEHTASSTVVSQLSTASSVSAEQRCLPSSNHTCPERPDADATRAMCLRLESDSGLAQANHRQYDLLVRPVTSVPQSPPELSASSSVIQSPPAPLLGTPPFRLQSQASIPRMSSRLQQPSASLPQSSRQQPPSPVKSCANVSIAMPHGAGHASASMQLQGKLSTATQSPQSLHPEDPGYSASSSSTAPVHLSKLQSFSSSSGTHVHGTSATVSQLVLAVGQATSVRLDWRLGQHSPIHGHCTMTAQPLSAVELLAGITACFPGCWNDMGSVDVFWLLSYFAIFCHPQDPAHLLTCPPSHQNDTMQRCLPQSLTCVIAVQAQHSLAWTCNSVPVVWWTSGNDCNAGHVSCSCILLLVLLKQPACFLNQAASWSSSDCTLY